MTTAAMPTSLHELLVKGRVSPAVLDAIAGNVECAEAAVNSYEIEALLARRSQDGVTVVKSRRLKNLVINWKGVMLAMLPAVVTGGAAVLTNERVGPVIDALFAIALIAGLADVPLSELEAKIVMFLWRERAYEAETSVDDLLSVLGVSSSDLDKALARLLALGAIRYSDNAEKVCKSDTILFKG